MEKLFELMQHLVCAMILLVAIKAIIGFHFPWETCDCCGKKWKQIRKEKHEAFLKRHQEWLWKKAQEETEGK